jgi:hypothetical protein
MKAASTIESTEPAEHLPNNFFRKQFIANSFPFPTQRPIEQNPTVLTVKRTISEPSSTSAKEPSEQQKSSMGTNAYTTALSQRSFQEHILTSYTVTSQSNCKL